MSFLTTLVSAFKGGASERVPLARGFASPWFFADGGGARAPFGYAEANEGTERLGELAATEQVWIKPDVFVSRS